MFWLFIKRIFLMLWVYFGLFLVLYQLVFLLIDLVLEKRNKNKKNTGGFTQEDLYEKK